MGTPNWILFLAYWVANSRAVRAIPTDPTAIIGAVISRAVIAFLKPSPSPANRFFLGALTFLNVTAVVFDALWPILSIGSPWLTPSKLEGTMRLMIPLCFFWGSVVAKTRKKSAYPPLVIHIFVPLSR